MNIIVTLDSNEVLDKISKDDIKNYIIEKWEIEDLEKIIWENRSIDDIWDSLEDTTNSVESIVVDKVPVRKLLREIPEENIVGFLKDHSEYFVAVDVDELMEQINNAGLIQDVEDMFEVRYCK